jgi:hypothetical protein
LTCGCVVSSRQSAFDFTHSSQLSVTIIQEESAAAAAAAGPAVKKPAAVKKRKAPQAKAWRCGNPFCTAEADDDEADAWTACSTCEVELWFCPESACQAALRLHERTCKLTREGA